MFFITFMMYHKYRNHFDVNKYQRCSQNNYVLIKLVY